jgi:hypothetical protein
VCHPPAIARAWTNVKEWLLSPTGGAKLFLAVTWLLLVAEVIGNLEATGISKGLTGALIVLLFCGGRSAYQWAVKRYLPSDDED